MPIKTVVFSLRTDTGNNNKHEGEVNVITPGMNDLNLWNSPMLTDNQIFVCVGNKAVKDGYRRYNNWIRSQITPGTKP